MAESAVTAGLGVKIAQDLIDDIVATAFKAPECLVAELPKSLPEAVADSIVNGINTRPGQLSRVRQRSKADVNRQITFGS